jgi:phage tail sheath protein FI
MVTYITPGVYKEERFPEPIATLQTGVPAFLGYTRKVGERRQLIHVPQRLTRWQQFEQYFGALRAEGYLGAAVRGFFENGGRQCYVVPLDDSLPAETSLQAGLAALAPLETLDLVCAPDVMRYQPDHLPPDPIAVRTLQTAVLDHCDRTGDRLAILDALPGGDIETVLEQRRRLSGHNGALYFPWLDTGERDDQGHVRFVPPCGHVAGVYARSDARVGVYKAPANEVLEGVLDLEINLSNAQQGRLNPVGINALRVLPGRGIRVWGARTISPEAAWMYVNVRRLFLTAGRWIEHNLANAVFEPNGPNLWARLTRELTAYFNGLLQQGALQGATSRDAFYVKCDGETNPPEVRDAGQVITEVGLASTVPGEFIVIRIVHGASGVTMSES